MPWAPDSTSPPCCWAALRARSLVWVGIGLATFQQLVGINVVFYYGAVLWQSVGFSESDALLINVISGAVSIGACLVTVALIDRIGRKPLLWIGSIGMALTLGIMTVAFASAALDADGALKMSDAQGTVALLAANLYVCIFNATWGPVMWVMLGEMFPNQIRGSALSVSGLAQWGSNFGITMTFPILLAAIGLAGAYAFYAAAAAASAYFVLRYVHETRGLELEGDAGVANPATAGATSKFRSGRDRPTTIASLAVDSLKFAAQRVNKTSYRA